MSQLDTLRDGLIHRRLVRLGQWGRAPQGCRQAAVLMLFSDEPEPTLLFTERAGELRSHAGQVSFPGGGAEPGESPSQTALREAHEEVGLDASQVNLLGELPTAWVPVSGYEVTPVVGSWDHPIRLEPSDPREVAHVLQLRVSELVAPEARVMATLPSGYRGPAFRLGDWFIWGMTAHLMDATFRLAGWEQPWDRSQTLRVPHRFLRD